MIDKKFIGKKYPAVEYEVSFEAVRLYAQATGQESPIFNDRRTGLNSEYHGCLAPPCFASYPDGISTRQMFFDTELNLDFEHLVHGEQDYEFLKPVVCGDILTITGSIENIIGRGDNDILIYRTEHVNQRGELVTVSKGTFVIRGV